MKSKVVAGVVLACLLIVAPSARAIIITYNNGLGHAAEAEFSQDGTKLTVTLSNIGDDVLVPTDVLTALFFSLNDNPDLDPFSAFLADGSTVEYNDHSSDQWVADPTDGNVGGEWAYEDNLSGAPLGLYAGISSTGLDLFGDPNFNGLNLWNPYAVNGGQYGILSRDDDLSTGNGGVTKEAHIKSSVVFSLDLPEGYQLTSVDAFFFQYGTSLTTSQVPDGGATLSLLGMALAGVAVIRRFMRG